MAKSYRTQKESIVAERKIKRDKENNPIYPPIMVRAAREGDIHPLTKTDLMRLFKRVPLEYLYGIRRIELKPRLNDKIGHPFGKYSMPEKVITLFSLPLEWQLTSISDWLRTSISEFCADILQQDNLIKIKWSEPSLMSLWFFCEVFTHELGHHFKYQYYHKNGHIGTLEFHREFVADLHSKRLTTLFFRTFGNIRNK